MVMIPRIISSALNFCYELAPSNSNPTGKLTFINGLGSAFCWTITLFKNYFPYGRLSGLIERVTHVFSHQSKDLTTTNPEKKNSSRIYQTLLVSHPQLKILLGKQITLYISLNKEKLEIANLTYLGEGGSKRAYSIRENKTHALLVPRPAKIGLENWKKTVDSEVNMSQFIESLGLLSARSRKTQISLDPYGELIPAYVSQSFASFIETDRCYIADCKDLSSHESNSTWEFRKNFIFSSKEERLKLENWDLIIKPLVDDIAIMAQYSEFPFGLDCSHIAIISKPETIHRYELRYFTFDFPVRASLPNKHMDKIEYEANAKQFLEHLIDGFLCYEFGSFFSSNIELRNKLVERNLPIILAKFPSKN